MDWIPALLKHLSITKTGVVAALAAALSALYGPRIAPDLFEPLPPVWRTVALITAVFCGVLLATWTVAWMRFAAIGTWVRASSERASRNLSSRERGLLLLLAKTPTELFCLETIDFVKAKSTLIEMLSMAQGLEKKGLLHVNETYVSLTDLGVSRALDVQRQELQARMSMRPE